MNQPDAGVVIPLHNHAAVVVRAVRSVLAQTMHNLSLVVVDDGSTDGGGESLRGIADPRMTVLRTERQGPGLARNAGVASSTAEWIALLDADDEWDPTFLERTLRAARSTPSVSAVYTGLRFSELDRSRAAVREGVVRDYFGALLKNRVAMSSSSVLISRRRFLELGGFSSERYAEDIALWLKLACRCELYFIPDPLVTIHRSESSSRIIEPSLRIRGLDAVLKIYRELRDARAIPRPQKRHTKLFMQNLEAMRAFALIKEGRNLEAGYALAVRTRPTRHNWRLYVDSVSAILQRAYHSA